jgi:hypothetical protein
MALQTDLISNVDSILSDNRSPLTRGSELNSFLKNLINVIFTLRNSYVATSTGGNVTITKTTHGLNNVTSVRTEDMAGNQIFIANLINPTTQDVSFFSDTNIPFRLKLF